MVYVADATVRSPFRVGSPFLHFCILILPVLSPPCHIRPAELERAPSNLRTGLIAWLVNACAEKRVLRFRGYLAG